MNAAPTCAPPPANADFLTPAFFRDPYPVYRDLLARSPVFWCAEIGAWVVCPFEQVREGLSDKRFIASGRIAAIAAHFGADERARLQTVVSTLDRWMNFQDPPDHTRLRKLIGKSFTAQTIAGLEPKIAALVADLLDRALQGPSFDLVSGFSFQLPALVICELLGVPFERRAQLRGWSDGLAHFVSHSRVPLDVAEHAERMAAESRAYFKELIATLRADPGDNLLSRLAASAPQEGLTDDEVASLAINLFFAGFETTEGLIGNMVKALIDHPDQLALLRADPSLAAAAVEEALRFDSSVQKQSRIASVDLEILGQTIRRGEYVHFLIGAANRDPARFDRPDEFLITRPDAGNVSFGHGIHLCLGAPLARLEARLAITGLLARLPALEIAPPGPEYPRLFAIRKPLALRLRNTA